MSSGKREYLKKRNLSEDICREFRLGFSPGWDELITFLKGRKISLDLMDKAGVIRRRAESNGVYDYFHHRLIFPIADARGRTIAFGGRDLDGKEPKYLKSPETPVFKKSRTLFAMHSAKNTIAKARLAIVCEGYTDVMKCHEAGFKNSVG